jgi:hypothetical protein
LGAADDADIGEAFMAFVLARFRSKRSPSPFEKALGK